MKNSKSNHSVEEGKEQGDLAKYSSKIRTVEQTESEADNKSSKADYKKAPSTLGGDRHKHSAKGNKVGNYPKSDTDTEDHAEYLEKKGSLANKSTSPTGDLGKTSAPPTGPKKGWGTPHN